MKAILYKVQVQDDPVHSWSRRIINEIFIPHYEVGFNEEGYVFEIQNTREMEGTKKEIEMNDEEANLLWNFCLKQKEARSLIKKVFDKIERK